MVVYTYFITTLAGRQVLIFEEGRVCNLNGTSLDYIEKKEHDARHWVQTYFPIFPIIEFLFYMGWLKVAESIMNPLGQDDDDCEINYIINRNLAVSHFFILSSFFKVFSFQVSYAIVDSHRRTCPQVKDEIAPSLKESKLKGKQILGSAVGYK